MKSNASVVIVDDDPRIRESLESLFDSASVNAKFFSSAEEFLREQDLSSVGCLISDIKMAAMSGYDLQQHLLEHNINIPMIFITAYTDEKRSAKALAHGALTFLYKPFDGEELLNWVSKALKAS